MQKKYARRGLQEQREYPDGRLIGTYGTLYTSTGGKSHNCFRKQRNEYSLLIMGDREQRRVVRLGNRPERAGESPLTRCPLSAFVPSLDAGSSQARSNMWPLREVVSH